MTVLVTGAAGFIGYHLCNLLINNGKKVIGLDSLNTYYDVQLKIDRLKELGINTEIIPDKAIKSEKNDFIFFNSDLVNKESVNQIFRQYEICYVVNLAAQAGVRYSIENPHAYIASNINGFINLLECARENSINHFVYASSSSVYGLNETIPFNVDDNVDHPISLYAATKKSNELMAHTYSHLYNVPSTGLRFFTVYGPWGRPDMALFKFTKSILKGLPISIYNNGDMYRDFTYIDDVVAAVYNTIEIKASSDPNWDGKNPSPSSSVAPYKVYNVGNHSPVKLLDFIEIIENECGKKAIKQFYPIQPGDVYQTYADTSQLKKDIGFEPLTNIETGVRNFVNWYRNYYNV